MLWCRDARSPEHRGPGPRKSRFVRAVFNSGRYRRTASHLGDPEACRTRPYSCRYEDRSKPVPWIARLDRLESILHALALPGRACCLRHLALVPPDSGPHAPNGMAQSEFPDQHIGFDTTSGKVVLAPSIVRRSWRAVPARHLLGIGATVDDTAVIGLALIIALGPFILAAHSAFVRLQG